MTGRVVRVAEKLAFSPQDLIGIAAKEAAAGIEAAAECIRDAQELLSGCDDGGRPLTPGYAEKNAVDLGTLESISELLAKNEIDSAFTAIAGF